MAKKTQKGTKMKALEEELIEKNLLSQNDKENLLKDDTSWFIVIFHAMGGILSAFLLLFILAFMLNDTLDSAPFFLFTGCLLLGLAYLILSSERSDFLEYFALIFALSGEGMLFFGTAELLELEKSTAVGLVFFLYLGVFFLYRSTLHRFASALIVLLAIFYFAVMVNIHFFYVELLILLTVWVWLNEYSNLKWIHHKRTIGYALVVFILFSMPMSYSMVFIELSPDILVEESLFMTLFDYLSMPIYYLLGVSVMAMILLKFNLKWKDKLFISLLLATAAFYYVQPMSVNIAEGVLVLILGFYGRNKILMTLGVVGLIQNIFSFYNIYYLNFIEKSISLFVFGVLVLILALLLHLYLNKEEEHYDA